MIFDQIIGNENNKELLNNIVKSKKIPHSYIFSGVAGVGKKIFAEEFAKAVLCLDNVNKPCLKCKSCIEFESKNHPDFVFIEPDETSIKIEQIRQLKQKVLEKPIISDKKVYIINDSEKMTKEAQNSLLKVLEEPPEYVCIILITSNINIFLSTIKSRCIKIDFNPLTDKNIKEIININLQYPNIENSIIEFSGGSIEKALRLNEKKDIYIEIEKIFSKLERINIIDFLNSKDKIFKDKEEIDNVLDYINMIFLKKIRENPQNEKIIEAIKIINETKDRLSKNNNYDMTIDRLIIKVWEEVNG